MNQVQRRNLVFQMYLLLAGEALLHVSNIFRIITWMYTHAHFEPGNNDDFVGQVHLGHRMRMRKRPQRCDLSSTNAVSQHATRSFLTRGPFLNMLCVTRKDYVEKKAGL